MDQKNESRDGVFRRATSNDLHVIEAWLPNDGETESMAVNWKTTLEVFHKNGMWVWEDSALKEPVAYFWGSFSSGDSVLEVRPEFRRRGIGRAFVRRLLEETHGSANEILEIECAPPSSSKFWRTLGFDISQEGRRLIGRRACLEHPAPYPKSEVRLLNTAAHSGHASPDRSG